MNHRILKINLLISLMILQVGTAQSVFQALTLPLSARQTGLTGGNSSVSSMVPRTNPAALDADTMWLCLDYISFPAEIVGHHLQLITPFRTGVIGVSLTNIDYGTLEDSFTQEKFSARDLVIRTSWKSTLLNTLSYGGELGFIHSRIDTYSSSGLFANFGLRGRMLDRRLGLGLSLENAGFMLQDYNGTRESLPTAYRVAMNYQPRYLPAVLAVDAVKYRGEDYHFIASVTLNTSDKFTLRASTSSYKKDLQIGDYNEKFISGMAGGMTIRFERFTIDIGLQDMGPAGIISAFGLNYRPGW